MRSHDDGRSSTSCRLTVDDCTMSCDTRTRPFERSATNVQTMANNSTRIRTKLADDLSASALSSKHYDMSTRKRRRHGLSDAIALRTKHQLKDISRRNRLAVVKFLVRKRKQQKEQQRSLSSEKLRESQITREQSTIDTSLTMRSTSPLNNEMPANSLNIIGPTLKVSFDSAQKMDFFSLYYHRRCQPSHAHEHTCTQSTPSDNKLDLLLKAVDYIEKMSCSLQSNIGNEHMNNSTCSSVSKQ
jgi:hypothetical protein